jgi:hypothetical protein
MKIEIDLTAADFERLWVNSMRWQGINWEEQAARFDPLPEFSWTYAYWFDEYAALKMAEGFLSADQCSIHSDEAGGWVILTNYASPCHLRDELVSA